MSAKPDLKIVLCSPRGFCAGVVRAIDTVERALDKYGAPVYVRHEIVHNKYVVDGLKKKGAIFVEELAEIPENTTAPVVFSAHGVPKSVPADARNRRLFVLDATCPLVSKVHIEADRLFDRGHEILLIGHAGHPSFGSNVRGDPFEGHHCTGASVFRDLGLFRGCYIHDDPALQHLGQALFRFPCPSFFSHGFLTILLVSIVSRTN